MLGARASRTLRVVVAIAALGIAVCFGFGIIQARDVDRATRIINSTSPLTRRQARQAAGLLRSADRLYPGTDVTILEGELADAVGHTAQAVRSFTAVTRQEPDNYMGWLLLANSTKRTEIAVHALARLGALVPKVPAHG